MTGMTPPVFTFNGMWVLVPPLHAAAHHAFRILHGHAPVASTSMKTTAPITSTMTAVKQNQGEQADRAAAHLVEGGQHGGREADDDAGEDDQRHPVADAPLRDLLAPAT